ncbi:uncharacterized protein [Drosophila virilis]|uniref:Uncharacterized protein, isoform A n=2 Tax=Drosophila virilis TaxID=7244 RepID=B4LWX4_DROVI|nr:uncharacterized protein LOC6630413 isoform X1 [Drosophila virilis]EDW67721.1 uncharacterized protein Dvir_GJ24311, isoform A [Drosophila virilis]
MSGWVELQHEFRITTIYLLLILSIPTSNSDSKIKEIASAPVHLPQSQTATLKRMSGNKVDIPRLYSAYRVLLKESGSDVKLNVGKLGKRTAVADEEDDDAVSKSVEILKEPTGVNNTVKAATITKELQEKANGTKTIFGTTGDREGANGKCVPVGKLNDVEDEQNDKGKSKNPARHGVVIVKIDVPSETKVDAEKDLGRGARPQGKKAEMDSAELRIAELNRVYQDFVNAWKRPTPETRGHNLIGQKNTFPTRPFRLSALNALMNVVENLKQSNPVDEIVKAINDEMNPEKESLIGPFQEKNKRIISRSSKMFKRLAPNVPPDIQTGGLYEEYKKKLNSILQAHKHPRKSQAKEETVPFHANSAGKHNELTLCHCDSAKSLIMAVDSSGPKVSKELTPCHCEATRHTNLAFEGDTVKISNGLIPCHCAAMKGASLADVVNSCLSETGRSTKEKSTSTQMNKENRLNGGLKPYYLSNSKHRQMVWNDVPLIRPGSQKKGKVVKPQILSATNGRMNPTIINMKSRAPNAATKTKPKTKIEQAVSKSFLRKNATHSASFIKNQKQLQHILKVFQAKHRSMNVRKTSKRGLINLGNGFDSTPAHLAFPEVLVNKFGQTQDTGGKMIENMAKQLNVSPVEMAQRIASSSGAGSYPLQANLASQTNGCQVSMAASSPKIAPSATLACQQGPTANLAPMLEKILNRLQSMQDSSFNQGKADKLPCCFADPTDGAPCELTGSWESLLLSIRIDIRDDNKIVVPEVKPTCSQPKLRRSDTNRLWRQCVKMTPIEIKQRFVSSQMRVLNVTIQDTLPPRPREMMDNLTEWTFTGQAVNTLGGPISLTCRKLNSNLMGTFLGFCRRCGCIDTIFGSWTFCQPSRDCQDITMSIFDRRDILRRFSLDDARRERFKEQLYTKSRYAKIEMERQASELPT